MTLETLKPDEKVNLSINMIDTCIHICVDALRDQNEIIKEEELLEKVRARIMYNRRRHHEV
ncbi:MAG: hypothetical protein ACE5L6_09060 [Candidatus Bathyarchaeia archaeon]